MGAQAESPWKRDHPSTGVCRSRLHHAGGGASGSGTSGQIKLLERPGRQTRGPRAPHCVDAVITDPPYGVYLNPKALALNGLTGFPIAGSVASRFRNVALMPYLGLEYVLIVPEKWNEPQMCRICGFFLTKPQVPTTMVTKSLI